jgi:hypothetical protein
MNATSSSQSLNNDILNTLDLMQIGSIKRRLTNELVEFTKKGASIKAKYNNDTIKNNNTNNSINIELEQDQCKYNFVVTREYPFRPPKMFTINNKDYKTYLKIESQKTMSELKIYYGINCLYCKTIYCSDNWCPALKLFSLIDEFNVFTQYRYEIIYRVLAKKIIDKYLVADIDLLEWLLIDKSKNQNYTKVW